MQILTQKMCPLDMSLKHATCGSHAHTCNTAVSLQTYTANYCPGTLATVFSVVIVDPCECALRTIEKPFFLKLSTHSGVPCHV